METQDTNNRWHESFVSWGQLILSFVAVLVTLVGAWVVDKISLEHRLTQFEERQVVNTNAITKADEGLNRLRTYVVAQDGIQSSKMDSIATTITNLTVELAKHQAVTDALDRQEHRPGVRIPPPKP